MKLFRLYNKAKRGQWIFADDEQEAKELAVECKHVKRIENIIEIEDQTEMYRDSTNLEEVTEPGWAALRMPMREWVVRNG